MKTFNNLQLGLIVKVKRSSEKTPKQIKQKNNFEL